MRYFVFQQRGWPAIVPEADLSRWRYRTPVAVFDSREGALLLAEAMARRARNAATMN